MADDPKWEAHELQLYAQNTSRIYFGGYIPIITKLANAKAAGTYSRPTAVRMFVLFADKAAIAYKREIGLPNDTIDGSSISSAGKRAFAESLTDDFEAGWARGEWRDKVKPSLRSVGRRPKLSRGASRARRVGGGDKYRVEAVGCKSPRATFASFEAAGDAARKLVRGGQFRKAFVQIKVGPNDWADMTSFAAGSEGRTREKYGDSRPSSHKTVAKVIGSAGRARRVGARSGVSTAAILAFLKTHPYLRQQAKEDARELRRERDRAVPGMYAVQLSEASDELGARIARDFRDEERRELPTARARAFAKALLQQLVDAR